MEFDHLQPQNVWKYFQEICSIPRPSKHEEKIVAYLKQFAGKHQLKFSQDELGNVLIRKPATPGLDGKPTIVLQSHVDMVCEKNSDIQHNFFTDPIVPLVEDGWVRSRGTTLGADNGIGVAVQLALLESHDVAHGPVECLFTVDEETGLTGAAALKSGFFEGKILINLDSEEEGEFCIGCAGGMDTMARFPLKYQDTPSGSFAFKVSVGGLLGGHSGEDINKGHANAIKILTRFLAIASEKYDLHLVVMEGGNLRNAIPREAFAICTVPSSMKESVRVEFNIFSHQMEQEFQAMEKQIRFTLHSEDMPIHVFDKQLQHNLLHSLMACPHGVIEMSRHIEGLVETSTNLASVKMSSEELVISTSQRSSLESAKHYVAFMVKSVFTLAQAIVTHSEGYPGWSPNVNSKILKTSIDSYVQLFGEIPKVKAIHAGLECGLFLEKFPSLDMVSMGPTILAPHSPMEKVNIASVGKFWNLLVEVLKKV